MWPQRKGFTLGLNRLPTHLAETDKTPLNSLGKPEVREALKIFLEPISKLPTAVDRITMSNDSAQGRAVGAHPGSFSGGENCRWTSWAQTDSDPLCARSGAVILNTGAQWHMLPQSFPNYKTVHRRFQTWCRDEVLRRVLTDVANELRDRGALNEEECFIDATFVMAKGGGSEIGITKRGKGIKIMAIVDRHRLPLSVSTHAANHHEVRLVQLCFDFYMIEAKPENLIGDRAYDSDTLDADCEGWHRDDRAASGQPKQAAYARSAKVNPLHATLARRALLRLDSMAAPDPHSLEYHAHNFLGFVQLACLVILFKRF